MWDIQTPDVYLYIYTPSYFHKYICQNVYICTSKDLCVWQLSRIFPYSTNCATKLPTTRPTNCSYYLHSLYAPATLLVLPSKIHCCFLFVHDTAHTAVLTKQFGAFFAKFAAIAVGVVYLTMLRHCRWCYVLFLAFAEKSLQIFMQIYK